jgi:hypothetical protein
MPRTGSQLHHTRDPSHASTSRSKNRAAQVPSSKINPETAWYRLTHTLLRWCLYDGHCHLFSLVKEVARTRWPSDPVNPGLFPGQADRAGTPVGA